MVLPLTIVNNTATDILVYSISSNPCFQSFWVYTQEVGLLDHMVILFSFLGVGKRQRERERENPKHTP